MNRSYIEKNYKIADWDSLRVYYDDLLEREAGTEADFLQFLKNLSELESVVSEDLAWRYIKMTCDTNNKELEESYLDFVSNIQPNIAPYEDKLNKKINQSPYLETLNKEQKYFIYFRSIRTAIELFREENIPLQAELQAMSQKYGTISGAMTIQHGDEELTLQQAANFLKSTDRELRKEIYEKINNKRLESSTELDELYTALIQKRDLVSKN